jgi:hypothetical protein
VRRNANGVLLSGILLTVLACLGVVVLFVAGAPVADRLPGFSVSAGRAPRPRVAVSVAPTPTRSPTRAPTTPPPAVRPGPARTAKPTPPRTTAKPRPRATRTAAGCRAGSATVRAIADTYVDQSRARQSFGRDNALQVTSRDKSRNRRALVRFALPRVPHGCTLRSATLVLTARDVTRRRVVVSRAARGWNEYGVTWATAPGSTGTASGTTVSRSRVAWDVTSQVVAMRAYGNTGFVIRDAAENAKGKGRKTGFAARTSKTPPLLTLRWS